MPQVSVIMSVFNGELYLRPAIESILSQTVADFEFIIVDDGSTDATLSILRSYADPRIRIMANDANLGPTRSRNRALEHSTGELIAVQDADDISLPNRLKAQTSFLESHPEVGLVGSARIDIDEKGCVFGITRYPADDRTIRRALLLTCVFTHSAIMMRRGCINLVGGYRVEEGQPVAEIAEDWDLWLRISERFRLANLEEPLVKLRHHGCSSVKTRRMRHFRSRRYVLEKALERQSMLSGQYSLPADAIAEGWFVLASYKFFLSDADSVIECLQQAFSKDPDLITRSEQLYQRLAFQALDVCQIADGQKPYSPDWYSTGYQFMDGFARYLPTSLRKPGRMRSRFHVTVAFESAWESSWRQVIRNYLLACRHDPRWLYRVRAMKALIQKLSHR